DLAGREPRVPISKDAVLGHVRLDRVLLAALEFGPRRVRSQVSLEKLRAEDHARAVGKPLRVERAERQVRQALRLAPRERQEEDLPLLAFLSREREPRTVRRERRLAAVVGGRREW